MKEQDKAITGSINIDEKSMKQIMHYLKIEDHDMFVRYIKTRGIEHED
jgi:hypothetical protein